MNKLIYSVSAIALLSTTHTASAQDAQPVATQKIASIATGAAAASVATTAAAAAAPADPSTSGGAVTEVIVTGTRQTGVKAADSAAPIQVIGSQALQRVGPPDLVSALAANVPSLNAQAVGGDLANVTLSAALRGLSPNDTLVLVNGVRRHGTANLAVLGGTFQGGAAADLNFIPVDAIDHVEVLTDGAAAQYGTDAIAGVVNIILKKNTSGGNLSATGGGYYDGGGATSDITGNWGFEPIENGYFNVTFDSRFHGHSNRGNVDPRFYNHDGYDNVGPGGANAAITGLSGYPNVNQISGDAMYHLNIASYDAGYKFGDDGEIYSFGTYGHKNAQAFENTRVPSRAPTIWPDGFNPKEEIMEDDYQFAVGVRDTIAGWHLNLSTTYGKDHDNISTEGSANDTLAAAGSTQTDFNDGAFTASQLTSNFDVSKDVDLGIFASPLTVAFGAEYRHDSYQIDAGEPSSYVDGGAQSFPGYAPISAGKHGRDNVGVYGDLALKPIEHLQLDAAGRYEHYTDFGDATVGKLTARYDLTPEFAIRGTVSSGFRAPTLAEEYYTNVNVGPTTAFGQFAPDSVGAKLLGIDGLKPETSTNFSLGFVAHPLPKVTATLDAYYIKIDNRIVGSGDIYATGDPSGVNSAAVGAALAANGFSFDSGVSQTGIDIFANGMDTATTGAEFVVTYSENYGGWGHVDWSLTGALNTTNVTHIAPSPASIAPQVLYDETALSTLEDSSPKFKFMGNAYWTLDKWSVNLRETIYGESSQVNLGDDGVEYRSTINPTAITDLEVDYKILANLKIAIGANNIFNQYPDKLNSNLVESYIRADDNAAVSKYPSFSPFGINGGYYYGRVTLTF